jgi:hypothetical protein
METPSEASAVADIGAGPWPLPAVAPFSARLPQRVRTKSAPLTKCPRTSAPNGRAGLSLIASSEILSRTGVGLPKGGWMATDVFGPLGGGLATRTLYALGTVHWLVISKH